jgi:hypothetical protein
VVVTHSEKGGEANIALVIYHRYLALATTDARPWARRLEEALLTT